MKYISVIGAGTMGNGIAHHLALNKYPITLIDIDEPKLEGAKSTIEKNLERQVQKGKISEEDRNEALNNISFSIVVNDASNSFLIIEAVNENLKLKKEILRDLDAIKKEECILASNTSSISITELSSALRNPEKFIGMHFMNPVPIMPLVEIINGYSTSEETTKKIHDLTVEIKKTPVVVNDYPGFISNRILMPMINEAIYALFEGVAGVNEIDTVMKLGMAHPMGPLQLADFIGLDVCLSILKVLHHGFGNPKYAPCPLLINMVAAGKLGVKTKEGFYNYQNSTKELTVSYQFLK